LRFSFYSLTTGILAYLTFLILSSMLLINVVMMKFAERDLIQAKGKTGELFLQMIAQTVGCEACDDKKKLLDLETNIYLKKYIKSQLQASGFDNLIILNSEKENIFTINYSNIAENEVTRAALKALETKETVFSFYGLTWGVIWPGKKRLNIATPIFSRDQLTGAVTVSGSLSPIYQKLRKSEKIFFIYILMNTVIFVLFGIFLLSRNILNPINKLLDIAETFKEGEPFPELAHSSRNEIGHLYSSLNMMVKRIEENKKELKEHISSLKKANQELKSAQGEIIRSEKLASVGRLATGVAHEIGNPIGIILGYLDLLKREDLNEEERQDFLERTELEITRISQIIRQLLDFSRPTGGEIQKTNLHGLIIETLNMLKPQPVMSGIELKTYLNALNDIIWADPNQIKQVLLNIIINSIDALETVSHRKILVIETSDNESSIKLKITDTGTGIGEKDIARIFDPFYTTKEPGKGTGLGLSICYRIIDSLGGSIRVESPAGEGMTVIIEIPVEDIDK